MTSSNVARTHEYLRAVASMGPFQNIAKFFAPDVILHEFPNKIVPQGRVCRAADLPASYQMGQKIMRSQVYKVQRIIESGDEIAVELEWSGILAVPVMSLPAGSEIRAFVAMFLTFRDRKIVSQRNYDCYPPFESQPETAGSGRKDASSADTGK